MMANHNDAVSAKTDFLFITLVENNAVTITGMTGVFEGSLPIPERINGLPVISIASNAFKGALASEIQLPETLRILQSCAFAGCINLREVVIPSNIDGVGCYLFGEDTHEVARAVVFQGETLSRAAIETAGDLGNGVVWHYQANGVDAWLRVKVDAISV